MTTTSGSHIEYNVIMIIVTGNSLASAITRGGPILGTCQGREIGGKPALGNDDGTCEDYAMFRRDRYCIKITVYFIFLYTNTWL